MIESQREILRGWEQGNGNEKFDLHLLETRYNEGNFFLLEDTLLPPTVKLQT